MEKEINEIAEVILALGYMGFIAFAIWILFERR